MKSGSNSLGPVLIGLAGNTISAQEKDWLQHPAVGGVVLFTRNYSDPVQLGELTGAIHQAAGRRLLVAVDHEGGRVQRFLAGFTRLPALATLGRMYCESAEKALDYSYRHARVMASELLLAGVDLSFAPVLDLDVESCVIGDRAFASAHEPVIALGRAYLAGMHDAGMRTTGKHFPGHGSVHADSHVDDVCDQRSLDQIRASDLQPFMALRHDLDAMMIAHVIYPAVCPLPAGYSRVWLGDILRQEMGWQGTIFSDDLGMHAARTAGSLPERVTDSLNAGCDAVLVCQPTDVQELMAGLDQPLADASRALNRLHGRSALDADEMERVGEYRHWKASLRALTQEN
jgi:beta-N-acetylhexosaminidase